MFSTSRFLLASGYFWNLEIRVSAPAWVRRMNPVNFGGAAAVAGLVAGLSDVFGRD
jgi:hypothetical protein